MNIAHYFIRRPIFASVLSILITLVGAIAIPSLPVEQYPELAAPQVSVTSTYIGASAEVVESASLSLSVLLKFSPALTLSAPTKFLIMSPFAPVVMVAKSDGSLEAQELTYETYTENGETKARVKQNGVVVLTSDQEGMSNAMLEALWCGIPVVSTPVSESWRSPRRV